MASNRRRNAARKRVFEKSWFHQSIEHEAECDRVDYPRRLDWAVVILATVGTFQTPSYVPSEPAGSGKRVSIFLSWLDSTRPFDTLDHFPHRENPLLENKSLAELLDF